MLRKLRKTIAIVLCLNYFISTTTVFASVAVEDGVCCGITAQDMKSMEISVFRGDAVVIATGGMGMVFGKSTNSTINNGYAAARLYEQGAEFVQIHPTAIPGDDKDVSKEAGVKAERPMSISVIASQAVTA